MSQLFWNALMQRDGWHLAIVCQPICPVSGITHGRYEILLRACKNDEMQSIGTVLDEIPHFPSLARALDRWVIQEVYNLPDTNEYTVNLFSESLEPDLVSWLQTYRLNRKHRLIFETTERSRISEYQQAALVKLSELYPLWLDDLGCAFASDEFLSIGCFSGIKICGHIVQRICASDIARAIVVGRMITAQYADLVCIAEYVSSTAIWYELKRLQKEFAPSCDLWVQGWEVGKPEVYAEVKRF